MNTLLTRSEVARRLGKRSVQTIDKYCRLRKLAYVMMPNGKMFRSEDIEAFIEGRRVVHQGGK